MDNKYYIPNIEEFHVGFYYQFKYDGEVELDIEHENRWHDRRVTSSHYDPYMTYKSIEAGRIRVRYLNQKDIESLGWKHIGGKLLSTAEQIFYIGEYNLYFLSNGKVKIINDNENSCYECESGVRFDGYLKNKSELKILMNQLRIK